MAMTAPENRQQRDNELLREILRALERIEQYHAFQMAQAKMPKLGGTSPAIKPIKTPEPPKPKAKPLVPQPKPPKMTQQPRQPGATPPAPSTTLQKAGPAGTLRDDPEDDEERRRKRRERRHPGWRSTFNTMIRNIRMLRQAAMGSAVPSSPRAAIRPPASPALPGPSAGTTRPPVPSVPVSKPPTTPKPATMSKPLPTPDHNDEPEGSGYGETAILAKTIGSCGPKSTEAECSAEVAGYATGSSNTAGWQVVAGQEAERQSAWMDRAVQDDQIMSVILRMAIADPSFSRGHGLRLCAFILPRFRDPFGSAAIVQWVIKSS